MEKKRERSVKLYLLLPFVSTNLNTLTARLLVSCLFSCPTLSCRVPSPGDMPYCGGADSYSVWNVLTEERRQDTVAKEGCVAHGVDPISLHHHGNHLCMGEEGEEQNSFHLLFCFGCTHLVLPSANFLPHLLSSDNHYSVQYLALHGVAQWMEVASSTSGIPPRCTVPTRGGTGPQETSWPRQTPCLRLPVPRWSSTGGRVCSQAYCYGVCGGEGEKGDVCNVLGRPVMDDTLINRSVYVHVCMYVRTYVVCMYVCLHALTYPPSCVYM